MKTENTNLVDKVSVKSERCKIKHHTATVTVLSYDRLSRRHCDVVMELMMLVSFLVSDNLKTTPLTQTKSRL